MCINSTTIQKVEPQTISSLYLDQKFFLLFVLKNRSIARSQSIATCKMCKGMEHYLVVVMMTTTLASLDRKKVKETMKG